MKQFLPQLIQLPVILDLCLKETHDYCDLIVFGNLRFQNVFRSHLNAEPVFVKLLWFEMCF